jgi:hypothetical protein
VVNGTQHANHAVANPPDTHTHASEKRAAAQIDATKTPAAKRQATNTAMHRILNSHYQFSPNGAPPHRKSPTPNPASPRDESTQRRQNQHTPAAPHPNSPKQAHSSSPITWRGLNAHRGMSPPHRATPTRRDGAHGNAPARKGKEEGWFGETLRGYTTGLLHFRGPPAGE